MGKPVVSVLIPVYNVEDYLSRCLDSVLGQTLQRIEVICVNDGSTDGSLEILEKYRKKDKRLKIISKENGGLPSARNAGLDAARGEYIGFVDSDDYVESDMFEKLVDTARRHDSEVVICGANIFPEHPTADKWMYDTLSPWYRDYREYEPDLVYKCPDTTPFLWRNLIKKSLIDRENLRLDENIVLGEDKLFQAKVYPRAKGITVIPDKLYNYFWCRPESLMNQITYRKLSEKNIRHTKLALAILEDILACGYEGSKKRSALNDYFQWVIPFLYDTDILSTRNDKLICAKLLVPAFEKQQIDSFIYTFESWKQEQWNYIRSFQNEEYEAVRLSVVIPVEFQTDYLDETLRILKEIPENSVEFIFVNNGTNNANYLKLLKLMGKQKNISLYNTPKYFRYAECLNAGIGLAKGDYVTFLEAKDGWVLKERLFLWLSYAEEGNYEVCGSTHTCTDPLDETVAGYDGSVEEKMCVCDFHEALYSRAFLEEKELQFEDYAYLTGLDFWCKVLENGKNFGFFNENCYVTRTVWRQDWLETKKIEKMLTCLCNAAQISVERHLPFLHGRVYRMLNGDVMRHLIVNGTKIYHMPPGQCPNGENSQKVTMTLLYSMLDAVDYPMLKEAGFRDNDTVVRTLYEVIGERNRFLAGM